VQFEFGWLVDNRAYDQHGTGISAATGVHCQFRSPVFDVENVDELQVFYLPRPTLVAGGHVTVKLIGKVQYTLPNACCLPASTVLLLPSSAAFQCCLIAKTGCKLIANWLYVRRCLQGGA
jgi:hypothetical protein